MKVAFTGGGSGGHLMPIMAVFAHMKTYGSSRDQYLYIGSVRGLEATVARNADIPFFGIRAGKIRRTRVISATNLADFFNTFIGTIQSLFYLARSRPDVLLSTGGFVAVPPTMAAWLLRIPIVAHEQTTHIGLANRLILRLCQVFALSLEDSIATLPASMISKTIITGNPIRAILLTGSKKAALTRFALDADVPVIYITGGSLGAYVINQAVCEVLPDLLERYQIIHQCGAHKEPWNALGYLQETARRLPDHLRKRYCVATFFDVELPDILAAADLVIGRSGAGTIAEITALGKPSILIPLVPTSGDEQTKNAKRVEDKGGAVVVRNEVLSGEVLRDTITELFDEPGRLTNMALSAKQLGKPEATASLVSVLRLHASSCK